MNKKIAVLVLIFLAIILALTSTNSEKIKIFNSPIPTSTPFKNLIEIDYEEQKLSVSWFEMDKNQQISLIPNFTEKENASDIFRNNSCSGLVNGGFYTPENSPIGLFVSSDKKISNYQNNLLFNGFLKFKDSDASITSNPNVDGYDIVLQTGPVLFRNSRPVNLAIRNDSFDRRMVAGVTDSKVIFMSFYNKSSVFSGPYLGDLPGLIDQFGKLTNTKVIDAINLDGGSASAFYTSNFSLSEISPIGSAFCIK